MKKILMTTLFITVPLLFSTNVFAANLLDVKPVISENSVSIEISADAAMTYTYYKVPGQARAVVDIADTDPEKVEPLIVVNKSAVSSISVDKAEFSGIVVSRIIFNLASESDISVSTSNDRKLLTVTFGGKTDTIDQPVKIDPETPTEPKPVISVEPPENSSSAQKTAEKDDDPLGLDEPETKVADPIVKESSKSNSATVAETPHTKTLEPVVPTDHQTSHILPLTIKGIATGESYIEIYANQEITGYKTSMLSKPQRLVIDISAAKINQKAKTVSINKHGITKTRIGIAPKNIRVVLDTNKSVFPKYTLSSTVNGIRINFTK